MYFDSVDEPISTPNNQHRTQDQPHGLELC